MLREKGLHAVVSLTTGGADREFFTCLEAIRQNSGPSPVSISLAVSEAAPADTFRHFRDYAETHGLPLRVGDKPAELIHDSLISRPHGSDVLLLDARVLIDVPSLRAMRDVFCRDEMIGFAAPRSNAATIAQFPRGTDLESAPRNRAETIFRQFSVLLPKIHFIPAPTSDCLLVRAEVLDEFGPLNSELSAGAELELVVRANRCGYGAVLVNQAYAWRADPNDARQEWIAAVQAVGLRYPELQTHLDAYASGPLYEADRVLSGLVPEVGGRASVLFDFSSLAPYHNGTFEAARRILETAARQWEDRFRIVVMCSDEAARFHHLTDVPQVQIVPIGYERPCSVAFRFGQPFATKHVRGMARAAPINIWTMLDTIAWDCMYLRRPDLEVIWAGALEHGDAIIYISEAAKEQFHNRFRLRPGLHETVIRLSLDLGDYGLPEQRNKSGSSLLLIGNSFEHKRIDETAATLAAAFPHAKIVCVGGKSEDYGNVQFYESGQLPEGLVKQLFQDASVVIFPSTHEGFGLPVLWGLGSRRPVIARSIRATRELAVQLQHPANLRLYSSTSHLVELLRSGFPEWHTESFSSTHNWNAVAAQIRNVIEHLLRRPDAGIQYQEVLVPRIRYSQGGFSNRENRELAYRVADLENSLSWRLTRPLRMLADVYLGLRKRVKGRES
jgi:glycosyltransferase involved in cell wall biosynthesis